MKSSIKVLSNLEERCKKEFNSITDHIKDCYRELHDPPQGKVKNILLKKLLSIPLCSHS